MLRRKVSVGADISPTTLCEKLIQSRLLIDFNFYKRVTWPTFVKCGLINRVLCNVKDGDVFLEMYLYESYLFFIHFFVVLCC